MMPFLPGQAHEGMTAAPDMSAHAVATFLLGSRLAAAVPR